MDFALVLSTAYHILLALLGLGFLIFVHELGHFLAAKRCGIRVETFCLGFQPTLFGFRMRFLAFRSGETEYVIGMLPFGGYLKMAGEELHDEKSGAPDEFASKPPAQRALVLVAGASMNIFFAFVFFILAFAVGVPFESTTVGSVLPGGPAWHAGLRSGDRVLEVDGSEMTDSMELHTTLALGGITERELTVAGADGTRRVLGVTPALDRSRGLPSAGFGPARSSLVHAVEESSPSHRAGLRKGDRVLGFVLEDGSTRFEIPSHFSPSERWDVLLDFMSQATAPVVTLEVEKPDGARSTLRVAGETRPQPVLGAAPVNRVIALVHPASAAARVLEAGWEIVLVNDRPITRLDAWSVVEAAGGKDRVTFATAHGRSGEVRTNDLVDWLRQDVAVIAGTSLIDKVAAGSLAARHGLREGDRLLTVNGQPIHGNRLSMGDTLERLLADAATAVRVTWSRDGMLGSAAIDERPAVPRFLPTQETHAVIGSLHPEGAAVKAGLLPGDRILKLNDAEIDDWEDVLAQEYAAPANGADTALLRVLVRRGDAAPQLFEVVLEPSARYLGFGLATEEVKLHKPMAEACVLGAKRTLVWVKKTFLTLRALARREVAARNLSGPVGMIHITKEVVQLGWGKTLFILALISLNLGILNLLPFPILDGGHLTFLAIEKLKGSPVSDRVQYWAHLTAFVLLISLALFVTYHDIQKWRW